MYKVAKNHCILNLDNLFNLLVLLLSNLHDNYTCTLIHGFSENKNVTLDSQYLDEYFTDYRLMSF